MTLRFSIALSACLGTAAVGWTAAPAPPDLAAYSDGFARWEPAIAEFEALDRSAPDPPGAVLLLGSSSIRLWETAATDLAPYPVVRRGYGGAKFCDFAHFVPRLIAAHRYRAVVVFVANDITGGDDDKSPDEIGRLFGYVADVLRRHRPDAPVICCDVRPAPSRFHVWREIQQGNAGLRAECDRRDGVHYLDTSAAFLTDDGSAAREDLYGEDRLHLNRAGYDVWSSQINAELVRRLGP